MFVVIYYSMTYILCMCIPTHSYTHVRIVEFSHVFTLLCPIQVIFMFMNIYPHITHTHTHTHTYTPKHTHNTHTHTHLQQS